MSIYLEFPSIEDYPVYSSDVEGQSSDGLIPASPFNWLLSLEFSALGLSVLLDSPNLANAGTEKSQDE